MPWSRLSIHAAASTSRHPLKIPRCCRCAKDEFNPKAQLFLTPLVQAMRLMIHLGETVPEGAAELAYHISAGETPSGGTLDRHIRKRFAEETAMFQYMTILNANGGFPTRRYKMGEGSQVPS